MVKILQILMEINFCPTPYHIICRTLSTRSKKSRRSAFTLLSEPIIVKCKKRRVPHRATQMVRKFLSERRKLEILKTGKPAQTFPPRQEPIMHNRINFETSKPLEKDSQIFRGTSAVAHCSNVSFSV